MVTLTRPAVETNIIFDNQTNSTLEDNLTQYIYAPDTEVTHLQIASSAANWYYQNTNQTTAQNLIIHSADSYLQVNLEDSTATSKALYTDNEFYAGTGTAATNYYNVGIDYGSAASTSNAIIIEIDSTGNVNFKPTKTERELKRERIRNNLIPQILTKRFGAGRASKKSEARAREALRELIGEVQFKRYLKNGFITVNGDSGRVYQIFPGHGMTKVWHKGTLIEKLCVVYCDSSLPPTDSIIMRMLWILDSEEEFRKQANVFPVYQPLQRNAA